jgi:tetratricopeptide (TPR) repeat protein
VRRTSSKAVLSAARGILRAALLIAVCSTAFSQGIGQAPELGTPKPGTPEPGTPEPKTDLLLRDASRLYQARKFEDATAKYQAALAQDPHSAEAYAGITRCYLKAGKMQEADETAKKAAQALPDSEIIQVVLGEVYFRQGRMHDAEEQFLKVVNPTELRLGSADLRALGGWGDGARAYLGLARLSEAVSMPRRARQMLEKAHTLNPGDVEIEWRWLNSLPITDRVKALSDDLASAKIEDAELAAKYKSYPERLKQQEKQPPHQCAVVNAPGSVQTYLWPFSVGGRYLNGFGLDVKVNGKGSRLLVDTGVNGILLSPAKAAQAGIIPRWQSKIIGISDKQQTDLYFGYADSIRVGSLEFRDCPVQVSAKDTAGHDGLVGPDFFSDYLVTLDFPGQILKLSRLPQPQGKNPADDPPPDPPDKRATNSPSVAAHPDDDQDAEESYVPPGMASYTKVFRFDHMLLVPTWLNDSPAKLFVLDTGSDHNYISPQAAREVTKISEDYDTRVLALNGPVKKVYRADKATLTFGRYRHEDQDLVSFDLSRLSQNTGTEISGTLGFALLRLLKITIDYRDGLVDFSYDPTRVH